MRTWPLCIAVLVLILSGAPCAHGDELSFITNPLWLSTSSTTEGQPVRVSTVVTKEGDTEVKGEVTFYAAKTIIGATEFSLAGSESGKVVTVSWTPASGNYPITAKITRALISRDGREETISVTKELRAAHSLVVLKDTDRDTKPDVTDPDDDNDGLSDIEEKKNGTNPLVKEVKPTPKVLGASTTATTSSALVDRVVETAASIGNTAFDESEQLRRAADAYVDAKLADIEASIAARPKNTSDSGTTSIQFRSIKDQVGDVGGILESTKYYALKCIGFIVGSIYAFYLFLIAVVLLVLRKIWRRHSLD